MLVEEVEVKVEDGEVKKARAAKAGRGVGPAAELLVSVSDDDDKILSEVPCSSTLPRVNCVSFLSSALAFPAFSSVIILTSSFPLLSCISLPSFFLSSSSSSWSQIMDASMLLRCSDPGEAAGLSEPHPDPDPVEAADLNGDVHPNV